MLTPRRSARTRLNSGQCGLGRPTKTFLTFSVHSLPTQQAAFFPLLSHFKEQRGSKWLFQTGTFRTYWQLAIQMWSPSYTCKRTEQIRTSERTPVCLGFVYPKLCLPVGASILMKRVSRKYYIPFGNQVFVQGCSEKLVEPGGGPGSPVSYNALL